MHIAIYRTPLPPDVRPSVCHTLQTVIKQSTNDGSLRIQFSHRKDLGEISSGVTPKGAPNTRPTRCCISEMFQDKNINNTEQ